MLLHRHYIKEFLLLLVLLVVGLSVVISMYENMDKLGDFKPYDPTITQLFMYWINTLPRYFMYLLPMGALLSGMFTVGQASRNRELVAYMAAGGRLKRLLAPFILMGLALSLLTFFLSEVVVPYSSARVVEIESRIILKARVSLKHAAGKSWLRADDGSIVKMGLYVPFFDYYNGINVFSTDGGRITRIITASRARYVPDRHTWELSDVTDYYPATGQMEHLEVMDWSQLGPPTKTLGRKKKPYAMNFIELRDYIHRLREAGFENFRLEVEMHSKLSYPLVNLVVLMLAVSFASKRNLSGLFAASFSLLFVVAYWLGFTVMLTMGYARIVPPLVAVWVMPVLFGAVSAWLFYTIPE